MIRKGVVRQEKITICSENKSIFLPQIPLQASLTVIVGQKNKTSLCEVLFFLEVGSGFEPL